MIGVVTGLAVEAKALRKALGGACPAVRVAPGPDAAEQAALALADAGCDRLISFGVAGALTADLATGDLLIVDRISGGLGGDTAWAKQIIQALPAAINVRQGALYGSDRVIATPGERRKVLADHPEALGVDMESHGVAQAAAARDLPWIGMRAILDRASDRLPDAAVAAFQPGQGLNVPALMAALARKPSDIAGLMALGRQQKAAVTTLRQAAPALLSAPYC